MGWKRPEVSLADLFWQKVNKDGPVIRDEIGPCWIWMAAKDSGGYGRLGKHKAHRVAWFLAHGEWPARDALHRCDTRACVRDSHLFQGDDLVNARDRKQKGRDGDHKGSANGRAKLDAEKVREIRARYASGERVADMPARFGVSLAAIRFVLTGRTWTSV